MRFSPTRKCRIGQLALSGAVVLAGMAALGSLAGGPMIGCGADGGCDAVLASKWSTVFGIPVALPAALLYLATLELSWRPSTGSKSRSLAMRLCGGLISAAAVYFVALQVFVVDGLCVRCLATHALAVSGVLMVSSGRRSLQVTGNGTSSGKSSARPVSRGWVGSLPERLAPTVVAVGIVGCLAVIQWTNPGQIGASRTTVLKVENGEAFPANPLITPFTSEFGEVGVSLDGGLTPVFAATLPLLSFKAEIGTRPLQVALLNDWTCPQCLDLHSALHRIYQSDTSGSLPAIQIRLLPAFLDEKAEAAHRAMLFVHFSSGETGTYPALAQEIAAGALSPDADSIRKRLAVIEPQLASRWETLSSILASKVGKAFALADFQMRKNRSLMQVSTLPQLTVFDSILSGLPTDAELADFLREAAARQQSLLASPLAAKTPDVIQTCNCDPSKLPAGILHDRACILFATMVRNDDPRLMDVSSAVKAEVAAPVSTAPLNGPRIRFDAPSLTTPTIAMGGVAHATFHFKNTGTEPLEILGVQTGCVCVVAYGWQQTVLPGQSGRVSFSYDSGERKAEGAGIHVRNLWVASNSVETEDPTYGHRLEMKVPVSFSVPSSQLPPGAPDPTPALAIGR